MFRRVGAAIVVLGLLTEACMVGRDLNYSDPTSSAISGGGADGGAGAPGAPGALDDGQGGGTAGDEAGAPLPDGGTVPKDAGHDATTTQVLPPGCPTGSAVETEPNDTKPQANQAALGVNCGTLAGNDVDFFTFVVGDNEEVDLVFHTDGDASLFYIDADDAADAGDTLFNGGKVQILGASLTGHHYFVKVSSQTGATQSYRFTATY